MRVGYDPTTFEPKGRHCATCEPAPSGVFTSDDRTTPPHVLEMLSALGEIWLDPCANRWSPVKAKNTFSLRDGRNGLDPWPKVEPRGLVYVNPPYSAGKLDRWASHIAMMAAEGFEIAALTPGDYSTGWWATLYEHFTLCCLLDRRVHFGGHGTSNPATSALWYFGESQKKVDQVEAAWLEFGYVLVNDRSASQ